MIDFLFTFRDTAKGAFIRALQESRPDTDLSIQTFSGDWGTLTVYGRAYPGFEPVETDRFVVVVLGGPLPRNDLRVADGTKPDDGTRWILAHWKKHKDIQWDDDLVGHFLVLCIDKLNNTAEIVTDINSFVPCYIGNPPSANQHGTVVGSHADAVALACGCGQDLDPVSIVDFLAYKTVTYPYTMYHGVRQLAPASVIRLGGDSRTVNTYWAPGEIEYQGSISDAACELRDIITKNVARMCAGQKDVGLLMSAGEDSRAVASLIPKDTKAHAVTFTDSYNREARIARRVCERLGVNWTSALRSGTHYLDYAPQSIKLSESHNLFFHAHVNGFVHTLPPGSRVLGGLFADALFKGSRIQGFWKAGVCFSICKDAWRYAGDHLCGADSSYIGVVETRRSERNTVLRKLCPGSWAEWHSLTPATMNTSFTNLIVNRRLFNSYEPFIDSRVFRLSASLPQSWKVNRRLFHLAMRPAFKRTWSIPHGKRIYPYFGLWVNAPRLIANAIKYRLAAKVIKRRVNNGPWPIWEDVVSEIKYKDLMKNAKPRAKRVVRGMPSDQLGTLLDMCANGDAVAKLTLLQVYMWLQGVKPSEN